MPMTPGSPVSPRAPKSCRPAHPGDDRIPNRDAKWRSSRKHFHQSFGLDRSCRPPLLLSFWDGKRLRKTATDFKPAPKKILTFSNPCSHPTDFGSGRPNPGFTKKSTSLLKPKRPLLVFCVPRYAVRAPLEGPAETGAGGVRRLLVPNLLNGGFGYENLRLHSPVAVHHPPLPPLLSR